LLTLIDPLRKKCIQRVSVEESDKNCIYDITSTFMTAAVNEA